jgi:transcriptional regulator of arginine metabolism
LVESAPAPATARLTKSQRQHRIATLLARQAVSNQAQVVELLAEQGVQATQGTVSRDLEELGALKIRTPQGELAYAIPALPMEQQAPPEHLKRVFGEWVVAVDWSANLVVVRTPPGSAHVVGSALDRAGLPDVVGTVAGDDTVLVVAAEEAGGAKVAQWLSGLAGSHLTPRSPARARGRSGTRRRAQGR